MPECGRRAGLARWWVVVGIPGHGVVVGLLVLAGTVFADDSEPCHPRPAVPAQADMVVCTPGDIGGGRGVPVTIDPLGRVVPDER